MLIFGRYYHPAKGIVGRSRHENTERYYESFQRHVISSTVDKATLRVTLLKDCGSGLSQKKYHVLMMTCFSESALGSQRSYCGHVTSSHTRNARNNTLANLSPLDPEDVRKFWAGVFLSGSLSTAGHWCIQVPFTCPIA